MTAEQPLPDASPDATEQMRPSQPIPPLQHKKQQTQNRQRLHQPHRYL